MVIKILTKKQVGVCGCGENGVWLEVFQAHLCPKHAVEALPAYLNSQPKMRA